MKRQIETAFQLPRPLLEDELRIDEAAEKGRKISEFDWNRNLEAYHKGNKAAKTLCLSTIAFLRKNNPHPGDSIALAKQFVRTTAMADWHPAILVLKSLGDPQWQSFNDAGLKSKDSAIRESYRFFDVNVLKLPGANAHKDEFGL